MPNHIHILLRMSEEPQTDHPSVGTGLLDSPTGLRRKLEGPFGPVPTRQNSIVSRFVSTFKRFCNKEYGQNIWQERSYDHIIRDQADFDKHLQYIYENPFGWKKDDFFVEE